MATLLSDDSDRTFFRQNGDCCWQNILPIVIVNNDFALALDRLIMEWFLYSVTLCQLSYLSARLTCRGNKMFA